MVFDPDAPASQTEALFRPTWAEIDLSAAAANARRLAGLAGPAAMLAVVKADGYGHGAIEIARTALSAGASWLGVAALEEAVELRRAGITAPILVISAAFPAQAGTFADLCLAAALFDPNTAEAFAAAGRLAGRPVEVHLKVDTGMGRLGLSPGTDGLEAAAHISRLEGLEVTGVYTHYATSDEEDKSFARHQTEVFDHFLDMASRAGLSFQWRHAANSAALIDLPDTRYNLVRAGISLYGLYPSELIDKKKLDLDPVMTWKTRVAHVKLVPAGTPVSYGREFVTTRPTLIGTLPVGYADGYRRAMTHGGRVLVRGRSCPVIGRVCMDHTMVALDDVPEVKPGDEVVLLGCQGGAEGWLGIPSSDPSPAPDPVTPLSNSPRAPFARTPETPCVPAEELAATCGTINYEIVSTVGRRVPRLFFRGGRPVAVRSILGYSPLGGDRQ